MLPVLEDAPAALETATGPVAVVLLAVLQGLAEFLPISSSGHLALGRAALGIREAGLALDVALHVGTLAAVVWAYRADVRRLVGEVLSGRWRMFLWLLLATLPTAVVGLLARSRIETAAQTPRTVAGGLFVTALVLIVGEWARGRGPDGGPDGAQAASDATPGGDGYGRPAWGLAIGIGLAQVIALWPGISRSGTTIAAGLVLGLRGSQAARLSFLMSLPAISGAAILELPGAWSAGFGEISAGWVGIAMGVSALVGWVALRGLLLVLNRGALRWFAAYCATLGTAVWVLL